MKLLIAEDDLTSQLMIKAIVAKAGYDPIITGDGQTAYETLLKPDAPKLAVLDWMMPGMDGAEVCRKIRDDKQYWQQVESYVTTHTEVQFSHGVCPDCYQKYIQPELDKIKSKIKSNCSPRITRASPEAPPRRARMARICSDR